MNDNVKKIPMLEKFAAQSLVYVDTGLSDGKELIFSKEKFALLIVAECLKLNSKELSITAIERLLPLYREHFGIEE